MDKVSVIIPVYNAEKYLHNTLMSIVNQSYINMEVILVDDGSTDNSKYICEEFAREYSFFRVIHQKNGGVSNARNNGIKVATGDYIFFCDADDIADSELVQRLVSGISYSDLVICGYQIKKANQIISVRMESESYKDAFSTSDLYIRLKSEGLLNCLWNKLFIKNKIKKYFDESLSMGEDLSFILNYMNECQSVNVISDTLYYYYQREGSATGKIQTDRVETMINLWENEIIFFKNRFPSESQKTIDNYYYDEIVNAYLVLQGSKLSRSAIITIYKKWLSNNDVQDLIKRINGYEILFDFDDPIRTYKYMLKRYGIIKKFTKRFYMQVKDLYKNYLYK